MTNETIADIIVEMRDLAEHRDWHNHTGQSNRERVSDLADRLDRARTKMEIEMANLRKENAKLREDLASPECQVKPLSLDEAIAHADEVAGDCSTSCQQAHKQLADWLRELKNRRNGSGDAAKLREALVLALSLLDLKEGVPYKTISQKDIDFIKAALAEPPKNCNVGTAEEQGERFSAYCQAHKHPESECLTCPLFGLTRFNYGYDPLAEGGTK